MEGGFPSEANNSALIPDLTDVFFGDQDVMRKSILVLCDSGAKQSTDHITPTILTMLTCPLQIYLTPVGWQPFRAKELTYPYNQMTPTQKQVLRGSLVEENISQGHWGVFEHAMVYRGDKGPARLLKPLDVLSALCSLVLNSSAYMDKRLRVAVCNILLQRVQARVTLDKHTQASLNERLFPITPQGTPNDQGLGAYSNGGGDAPP